MRIGSIGSQKTKRIIVAVAVIVLAGIYIAVNIMGKSHITTRYDSVVSDKITTPVRLLLLSDLHCCTFGTNNADLMAAIDTAKPDVILLGGDILHCKGSTASTIDFIGRVAERYPCCYVTGNHEVARGEAGEIKNALRQEGVQTIGDVSKTITIGETTLSISGIDEYRRTIYVPYELRTEKLSTEAFNTIARETLRKHLHEIQPTDESIYSVVLIHRPEEYETVLSYGFDLMLSGHAHGGQVILPGVINGLYAPNQGLFPKVAGGMFRFGAQVLNVSRGLSKKPWFAARICNPPELVVIDLLPEN